MITIKKRTRNILFIVVGVILLILALLPTFIKNYAISNSKELIGRQIDIGKLKYNYFTSTVKVFDFKMFESNGTDYFTTLDTLILNLEPLKLFKDKIEIEQLYLKGLMVKTVMQDSTFNFSDLLAFHSESDDPNIEDSEPLKYSVSDIELKDSNFFFDNKNVNKETHIEDLSFAIPHIGWDQEEKSNADVKFNFKNGGYFQSALNVNPVNGEFDATVNIKNLNLKPFYEYVVEYAEINDFNGDLNCQILIHGNTNEAVNSIVSGHVNVNDLVMTDTNDKAFLKVKRIDGDLKKIDYANSAYVIDSLSIDESYTFFQLDSISNNFFEIFKLNEPESEVSSNPTPNDSTAITTSQSDLYYAINHLNVNNGILDYTDNITGQKFDYHLSEIQMDTDSIFSDSDWVSVYSDMLLNNRGTLNAKVGLNPQSTNNAEINITVEKFLLSDINIYSNHYMGHDILEGDFYYNTKTKITNGNISSENKLLVKNVSVSSNEKGLYKLPLKFALFLLKDKNGDVELDVPVRGDLNDPSVNVGKIVWTTFKKIIVNTVASPINFLAGLVDGDPKELEEIVFTYTDTIPSGKPQRQLDKLIDLESKKQGLKIEMLHFVDLNLQKEAIALAEIGAQYTTETKKDYLKDEKGFETYVLTKIGSDSLSVNDAVMKLSASKNLDSLASNYNTRLIKNTEAYLLEKNPFTKIQILVADPKEPEHSGSKSRFKMKYDMLDEQGLKTDSISTEK